MLTAQRHFRFSSSDLPLMLVSPSRTKKDLDGEKEGMILDDRIFRHVGNFDGKATEWGGWIFNLVTQMRGCSGELADFMDKIRKTRDKNA